MYLKGCGKVCLAAALIAPFSSIIGIEILESLHQMGLDMLKEAKFPQI